MYTTLQPNHTHQCYSIKELHHFSISFCRGECSLQQVIYHIQHIFFIKPSRNASQLFYPEFYGYRINAVLILFDLILLEYIK